MEGALLGIPSFALSQARDFSDPKKQVFWQTAKTHAPDILRRFLDIKLPLDTLVNINFPDCPPDNVKAQKIVCQGKFGHGLGIEERRTPSGSSYHWLTFLGDTPRQDAKEGQDTDIEALARQEIAIMPVKLDMTDHDFVGDLTSRWIESQEKKNG